MLKRLFLISLVLLGCLGVSPISATQMRRPLSVESPMYIFHIDTWNNADPQKIIELIPEDMLPYTVFNISLSVSADVTKDGYRTAESWLRTCAENRVWALIQPASGGHSWFSDYDYEVYRYFYETYPNLIGFNYCEQFWGFDDSDGLHPFGSRSPSIADRMKHFGNLLDLAHEYGGYLVISNCLVIPEWDGTSPLTMFKRYPEFAAKAKEHKDHLIYCEKYTTSGNFYDMESMCLGVYLSDYCDFYGMRFDQCGHIEHVFNNLPGERKFPPTIGGMCIMEHQMFTGQTVQDGPELIWQQCVHNLGDSKTDDGYNRRNWEFYPQFPNVYLDVWRKFTTDGVLRILPREEVIDSTRIAIYNDISPERKPNDWEGRRSYKDLFTGLYALDGGTFGTDTVFLKKTGRYPSIPTIFVDNGKELGFQKVVKQNRIQVVWRTQQAKIDDFNALFAPQTDDDPETSLYVRRQDNNWLVYNNSQYDYHNKLETSTLKLKYNSCSTVRITMPMYSFGLVTEKEDGLDLYLNNYSFLNKETTDEIVISGCSAEPTFSLTERGSHNPSRVDASYAEGALTLKVTHNGPLDLVVKCQGSNTDRLSVPEAPVTYGQPQAPLYQGTRQVEFENSDYKSVDKDWGGITKSEMPGFTALGYVSYGTKSGAKLRDSIRIDEPGTYKVAIRYLSPEGDIDRVNFSVGGAIKRNIKFPQTSSNNEWATAEFELELNAGLLETVLSSTKAQTLHLYLDNFTLTPINITGVERVLFPECTTTEGFYDLMGRPVNASRLQPGSIYIHSGKKILYR